MIVVKATLVAGSRHRKYAAGASMGALFFVNVQTESEMEAVASRELSELGWATMAIERWKDVTDYEQFRGKDTPEAVAFRDALESGFGVIVFPETNNSLKGDAAKPRISG